MYYNCRLKALTLVFRCILPCFLCGMWHFYYANVHYTIGGEKVSALRACSTLNGHPEGKAQAKINK